MATWQATSATVGCLIYQDFGVCQAISVCLAFCFGENHVSITV